MDATTQFIDTLSKLNDELGECRKRITKLGFELASACTKLGKGDIRDRETRVAKLACAKEACENVRYFVSYAMSADIAKLCGALEILNTLLDEKDDEQWILKETHETLSAPQTVDKLTDAITEYLLAHNADVPSPRARFVDNPDAFVRDFVASYLDHPVTDRMSDMVISLVTDWMAFRLPN